MNLPVVLSPTADREFEAAAEWYENKRAGLGTRFVAQVQDALDRIAQMPEQHAVVYNHLRAHVSPGFPTTSTTGSWPIKSRSSR